MEALIYYSDKLEKEDMENKRLSHGNDSKSEDDDLKKTLGNLNWDDRKEESRLAIYSSKITLITMINLILLT